MALIGWYGSNCSGNDCTGGDCEMGFGLNFDPSEL